jgi:hypothetical protein
MIAVGPAVWNIAVAVGLIFAAVRDARCNNPNNSLARRARFFLTSPPAAVTELGIEDSKLVKSVKMRDQLRGGLA